MYILLKISLKFLFLYSDPVRPLHMHVLLDGPGQDKWHLDIWAKGRRSLLSFIFPLSFIIFFLTF